LAETRKRSCFIERGDTLGALKTCARETVKAAAVSYAAGPRMEANRSADEFQKLVGGASRVLTT